MLKKENIVFLFCAGIILILSIIPRFYDIYKFLPYYSIDENEIVEYAVGFIGGDLDPHWYKYGPLYAYILSLVYYFQALISGTSVDQFMQDIFFNSSHFYYTARFINSLFSILLGYLTFLIAHRYFAKRMAFIVLLLALFPFYDSLVSFKIRVDTLLAVCITITLFFSLRIYERGDTNSYRLSGLFFGLALATKPLPALLLLPTLFLAHYFRTVSVYQPENIKKDTQTKKKKKRRKNVPSKPSVSRVLTEAIFQNKIWQLFGFALLIAVVANPYSLLNASGYVNEQLMALKTEGAREFLPGWDITRFFGPLGIPFVLSAIFSIFYYTIHALRTKNRKLLILISFPIIFWLAFARGAARNYFYVPIVPVLIILVAMSIEDIAVFIAQKTKRYISWVFISMSLILLLLFPLIRIVDESIRMNEHDNYAELHAGFAAKEWIFKNITPRSRILLYGYYVNLPRLIDYDPNQQAQYGEYFMYSRWKNEYLKQQFIETHQRYVREGNPVYDLENIRSRQRGREHLIYDYCVKNKIDFLLSNFNLSRFQNLGAGLLQQFSHQDYSFGSEVYIYEIRGHER